MQASRLWWLLAAAAIAPVLAACGATADSTPTDQVEVTFDDEFEVVTDTAAIAITTEERDELQDKCKDSGGVPGANDDCLNLIPLIVDPKPCLPSDEWCLFVGKLGDDPSAGVIQVVGQSAESDECDAPICSGVVIPVENVEVLVSEVTPSSSVDVPTTEEPTPTTTTTSDSPTTSTSTVTTTEPTSSSTPAP